METQTEKVKEKEKSKNKVSAKANSKLKRKKNRSTAKVIAMCCTCGEHNHSVMFGGIDIQNLKESCNCGIYFNELCISKEKTCFMCNLLKNAKTIRIPVDNIEIDKKKLNELPE